MSERERRKLIGELSHQVSISSRKQLVYYGVPIEGFRNIKGKEGSRYGFGLDLEKDILYTLSDPSR